MITKESVTALLETYHARYEWITDSFCALYDERGGYSRVHIEICNNGRDISYAGRIIGGIEELEARL